MDWRGDDLNLHGQILDLLFTSGPEDRRLVSWYLRIKIMYFSRNSSVLGFEAAEAFSGTLKASHKALSIELEVVHKIIYRNTSQHRSGIYWRHLRFATPAW